MLMYFLLKQEMGGHTKVVIFDRLLLVNLDLLFMSGGTGEDRFFLLN